MDATATSTVPVTDKPPRRRRSIPLSARMFVALLALLGVSGGLWVGPPAYRQHVAIREVEQLGGQIKTRSRGPSSLRNLVGANRMKVFDEVVDVDLSTKPATDATLSRLGRLHGIKWLRLDHTRVTDARLAHLKGMTGLQQLYLNDTQVTDAGLEHLMGLANLQSLWIANTKVTDSGLANLKGLNSLKSLVLGRTKVTDAGLVHLKGLTSLQTLALNNTQVTRTGVVDLKRSMLPQRLRVYR
ncbi:MAG: hypothetical protein HY290_25305 [Planctomycetia bacterium]|nr:hypothetical protein [Planctomycetia bacterium]